MGWENAMKRGQEVGGVTNKFVGGWLEILRRKSKIVM